MCTCTVLTFISWSLTGLYLITRSTCLAFRPDILDFKIVCLSIQRKKILFVTNYAQLSILKLFSAVLSNENSRFPYPILLPFSETEETLTQLTQSTHLHMCHSTSFMPYDVSNLERFPFTWSNAVFFLIPSTNYCFLTFFANKILLSASENVKWKSRNNCWVCFFDWMISSTK